MSKKNKELQKRIEETEELINKPLPMYPDMNMTTARLFRLVLENQVAIMKALKKKQKGLKLFAN